MSPLFKIRAVSLGILTAAAAVTGWGFHESDPSQQARSISSNLRDDSTFRVPVEVIATGSSPQIVYIEVAGQDLPESRPFPSSR